MFCTNCGKEIDDNAVICPSCGVPTDNMKKTVAPAAAPAPTTQSKGANGLAIAGLVLGLVGLFGGNYIFLIPGLIGLILSIVGMVKSKQYAARGLAIAALIVSIVSFVIWLIVWIALFAVLAAAFGLTIGSF